MTDIIELLTTEINRALVERLGPGEDDEDFRAPSKEDIVRATSALHEAGYAIVPVEATYEMLLASAALQSLEGEEASLGTDGKVRTAIQNRAIEWRAMLSAAPTVTGK